MDRPRILRDQEPVEAPEPGTLPDPRPAHAGDRGYEPMRPGWNVRDFLISYLGLGILGLTLAVFVQAVSAKWAIPAFLAPLIAMLASDAAEPTPASPSARSC